MKIGKFVVIFFFCFNSCGYADNWENCPLDNIQNKLYGGGVLILSSGSVWQVLPRELPKLSNWSVGDEVKACHFYMINKDVSENKIVEVVQLY